MFTKLYEKIKKFIVQNYKFLIGLVVLYLVFTIELPYVVYTPGGLVNLNERINLPNDNIKGSINMCYVSLMKGILPVLGLSYLLPNWDIEPRENVTIDNGSIDELVTLEKLYLESSIDNATIVAYRKLNEKLTITAQHNHVVFIADEAQTNLKLYDEIISVNGQKIQSLADLKELVNNQKVNDEVEILVMRDGKKQKAQARVYELQKELKIGISLLTTYDLKTDPALKVKTKASESGSSGGLMLALAIYNKLTPEDITKGAKIVGTGTIDEAGNVGAIDGVKYKLLGAAKRKAAVFFCPVENYDEALKVKREEKLKITIKAVRSFDEALAYLTNRDK